MDSWEPKRNGHKNFLKFLIVKELYFIKNLFNLGLAEIWKKNKVNSLNAKTWNSSLERTLGMNDGFVRTKKERTHTKKLKIMTEVYISFFFVGFVHFWCRLASNVDLYCNFQWILVFCQQFRISFFFVSSCIGHLQLHMSCPK